VVSTTARGSRRPRPDGVGDRAARQEVHTALLALRGAVPDLLGSLVASVDGLPLAHDVYDEDPAGIAAMAATAAGLGKRLVENFSFGEFDESVVRARHGYFVVYSAGPVAVLATTASAGANLGRLHLEARRSALRIALALEGGSR
jgi:predicted regulator of Ras-like GTPase activity (Roadblock/LC7/MglB family)